MTTTVQLDRWNTIVKEIKFDNKWNETLKNYLKEQKLEIMNYMMVKIMKLMTKKK